jgi:mono/diheme cytochrome c family protein
LTALNAARRGVAILDFLWRKFDMKRIARTLSVTLLLSIAALGVQCQSASTPSAGAAAAAPTAASIEAGRELFRANCVRCHGADATGTADAPNLLPRVKGMSEAAFSSAVLQRYRWSLPAAEAGGESAAREAMMRGLLLRRQAGDAMPAWESEPTVVKGVKSLYDFLSSKAR